MSDGNSSEHSLDIFEIPSQVSILFTLTIGILLLTLLGSVFQEAGLQCGVWLPLLVISLVLYDWFTGTDRELRRFNFYQPAPDAYPLTRRAIQSLTQQMGLNREPKLVVTDTHYGVLAAFGNIRRAFVGASVRMAKALEDDLASERRARNAEAVLLHELAHLKTGDVWRIRLVESSLRQVTTFSLWFISMGLAVVLMAFALTDMEYILSNEFRQRVEGAFPGLGELAEPSLTEEEIQQRLDNPVNAGLGMMYIMQVFGPLLISCGFLWWFFLRRMHQVREFYADALAANHVGASAMRRALITYSIYRQLDTPDKPLTGPQKWLNRFLMWFERIVHTHPDRDTRLASLENPWVLFRSPAWVIATTGVLIVLVELLISGPFSAGILFNFGGIIPLTIGFLALALNTWPAFTQQAKWAAPKPGLIAPALIALIWFLPISSILLCLLVMWFASPAQLDQIFEIMIALYAQHLGGLANAFSSLGELGAYLVSLSIFQVYRVLFLMVGMIAGMFFFRVLVQRVLMWPPDIRQRRMMFWIIPFIISTGLAGMHMLSNGIFFPSMYELFSPLMLAPLGILMLITLGGLFALMLIDLRVQGARS